MTFVGLLAVTVAIPAAAAPRAGGFATATVSYDSAPRQTLLTTGAAEVVQRDGYSAKAPPPPPVVPAPAAVGGSGGVARTADTFTNNPLSPVQWPFPVGVPITSDFGSRNSPCSGCSSFHLGIDMTPGQGTPIHAAADGVVTTAVASDGGGLGVYAVIDHVIDGQRVSSVYGHMLEGSLQLSEGQTVTVGQQVGNVGNTGSSTGAHLHFEIHLDGTPIDPFPWMISHVVL